AKNRASTNPPCNNTSGGPAPCSAYQVLTAPSWTYVPIIDHPPRRSGAPPPAAATVHVPILPPPRAAARSRASAPRCGSCAVGGPAPRSDGYCAAALGIPWRPRRGSGAGRLALGQAEPLAGVLPEHRLDRVGAVGGRLEEGHASGLELAVGPRAVVRLQDAPGQRALG